MLRLLVSVLFCLFFFSPVFSVKIQIGALITNATNNEIWFFRMYESRECRENVPSFEGKLAAYSGRK